VHAKYLRLIVRWRKCQGESPDSFIIDHGS
jgi:hypothetical protein